MKIKINEEVKEQVTEFCHLGSLISEDAKCHKEIKKRIAMGKEAFTKRKELLKGGLNRDLKKRMVKALIWSVTLYGAETWTMRGEDIKQIEAFEMWIWRGIETGEREKILDEYNQNKTEKLDRTCIEKQFFAKGYNGGQNGGEKRKRKA